MLFAQTPTVEDLQKQAAEVVSGSVEFVALVAGVVAVGVGGLVLRRMLYRAEVMPDLQKALREDLREYPPAPPQGSRVLTLSAEPVRLRLVVVAPLGTAAEPIRADEIPALLDGVCRGLGAQTRADKPRLKAWPPQLSVGGFAPTFQRLVETGDKPGTMSKYALAAGPAQAGGRKFLLGLALKAEDAVPREVLAVAQPTQWGDLLRIEDE